MDIARALFQIVINLFSLLFLLTRCRGKLAAENLFLRKQLAFYKERGIKPGQIDSATRFTLVVLSRLFDWKYALAIVQPKTLIRWHREGFRMFWRWKSKMGRPPIPEELKTLIRQMARENPLWGEERISNELLLKLGIRVSPRTVRKYMPKEPSRGPRGDQRWSTFLRNHAGAILACDFFVVVTVTFRILYVFVLLEHGSRRIMHVGVTTHPTAGWTLQQLRQAVPSDHKYRFLIHDRGRVYSKELDRSVKNLGLRVIKTPYRSPRANSICERAIGTVRRECLDHMIPLTENHLRKMLKEWVPYYNQSRPHSSLGPGVPEPTSRIPRPLQGERHRLGEDKKVISRSVLNGLHHDYRLVPIAA
jgi:transposase InsO family protein